MKNEKYSNGKKGMSIKPMALLLALALLVGCAAGGTIAWLTDKTEDVVNTFTVGDINIELTETSTTTSASGEIQKGYHFVPGDTLSKDPKVTVLAGSEKCYLFVKVTSRNNSCENVESIVNWTIRDLGVTGTDKPEDKWLLYKEEAGATYYYRVVANSDTDQSYYLLTGGDVDANGQVTISTQVTKDMVTVINSAKPVLEFDAAAVQYENIADVNKAFAQVQW